MRFPLSPLIPIIAPPIFTIYFLLLLPSFYHSTGDKLVMDSYLPVVGPELAGIAGWAK
jgi:hypothetical protein